MGFWHTGYIDFHEYTGLGDYRYEPSPPEYRCAQCSAVFSTVDALQKHRFESHPLYRPILLLNERELGSHPVRITAPLRESDVLAKKCDRVLLNGQEVPLRALPGHLAKLSNGVARLTLIGSEVTAEFTLDVRIALEEDLLGIEKEFERTATGRRLDVRTIDDFIAATAVFDSAIGYCDGICAYLYGVLAKERAPDSSLRYDAYVGKFNKAVEELAAYDRPLARTIGSLIEFHFNHFPEAARLAGSARIGEVASRYDAWLRGAIIDGLKTQVLSGAASSLEVRVSDWDTEQIARWAVNELSALAPYTGDMEAFIARDISEYDRVKVHILLAEVYAIAGDAGRSVKHAKFLRNVSAVEEWAERKIRVHSGDQDEHEQ